MKTKLWRIMACVCVLLTLMMGTASAKSKMTLEEKKDELRTKTSTTLTRLYTKQSKAKAAIEEAAGYAVFNNTGYKIGIIGSSHGRGMAVNNKTGEEVFMRMNEYQAGLGVSLKEYAVIFVFANEDAWRSFVDKGWSFGAGADIGANDGKTGENLEGAIQVASGIWMYQMTTKGLAMEVAVRGTNYFRDKAFYPELNKKK